MTSWRRSAAVVALASVAAACGRDAGGEPGASASGDGISGEVLVSAAASLIDAFADIESAFEAGHPGVDVVLNVGGSGSLAAQILEGAPVDVFAPADVAHMGRVVEAGLASGRPRLFARNVLRIAVPAGNPAGVDGLEDLGDESLRIGLCAPGVPCGDLARRVLERAGVAPALDTNEPHVRALLTKLELGELDAGIVYRTDVASTGGTVEGLDIPDHLNVVAEYPVAALAAAPNPAGAAAFVRFVLSDEGRTILARHGFTAP